MAWLKGVLVDILVTIVIAVYAFMETDWGYWIILIYTPLILLLKIGSIASGVKKVVKQKKQQAEAPTWFYHLLYALNFLLLLYANWWIMAGGWAVIWLLSAYDEARKSKKG